MVFKHPHDFGVCVICRCFIMSWNAVYPYACPCRSLKALHMCCLSTIGHLHLMLLLLTQSTDPCPYRTYNPHFYTSLYIPLSRREQTDVVIRLGLNPALIAYHLYDLGLGPNLLRSLFSCSRNENKSGYSGSHLQFQPA